MKKGFVLDSVYLIFAIVLIVSLLIIINKVSDEVYDGLAISLPDKIPDFTTVAEIKARTNSGYSNYFMMLPVSLLIAIGLTIRAVSKLDTFDPIEAFIHFIFVPFFAFIIFILVSIVSTITSVPEFSDVISRNNTALSVLTGMPLVLIGIFTYFIIMIVMFGRSRQDI